MHACCSHTTASIDPNLQWIELWKPANDKIVGIFGKSRNFGLPGNSQKQIYRKYIREVLPHHLLNGISATAGFHTLNVCKHPKKTFLRVVSFCFLCNWCWNQRQQRKDWWFKFCGLYYRPRSHDTGGVWKRNEILMFRVSVHTIYRLEKLI